MVNFFNFPRVTQSVASTRTKGIKVWHSGKSLIVRAKELVYRFPALFFTSPGNLG